MVGSIRRAQGTTIKAWGDEALGAVYSSEPEHCVLYRSTADKAAIATIRLSVRTPQIIKQPKYNFSTTALCPMALDLTAS